MINTRPSRRAFTLVELIAAMIVVAVIGSVGAMTLQRAAAANSQVATRVALSNEASTVMDRLVRFIQSSPPRAASSPAVPSIATFTPTTATWDNSSAILYNAADQTIVLRDTPSGDTATATPILAGNVSAFTMSPFNESNADLFITLGTTTLNSLQSQALRRVSISLTLTRQGQSVTLRGRAYLRCTMIRAADQ